MSDEGYNDPLDARLAAATANAATPADEFSTRRWLKKTLAGYRELLADPERLEAVDAEMAAFAAGEKALRYGIAALERGALELAQWQLVIAASAGFAAAAPYLAALYRRQGHAELAQSWHALAEAEGLPACDLALPQDGSGPASDHG